MLTDLVKFANGMHKQQVIFRDLGRMEYKQAWDYQENLLRENAAIKSAFRMQEAGAGDKAGSDQERLLTSIHPDTKHYLLFVEHPPVYTLGKSGKMENVLMGEEELKENGIQFFRTNRGGDITFHGDQQIVGYPILDLEKFFTDIGRYLRSLEDVIIFTLADFGIKGERSVGETGVWLDASIPGKERKICAMGVRTSRWITMHGFALNVNTDLTYFNHIIPCGIQHKQVTSIERELNSRVDIEAVKERVKRNFEKVFNTMLVDEAS